MTPDKATECAREIFASGAAMLEQREKTAAIIRKHFPTPPLDVIREAVELMEQASADYRAEANAFEVRLPEHAALKEHTYEWDQHLKLESALTRLRALVDGAPEGPTDKEMLDWLDHRTTFINLYHNPEGKPFVSFAGDSDERGMPRKHPDIRSAITAAMKRQL
jgi:hypothetical protein